jgi:tetratricopeptide (TPR) repeat protein
MEVDAGVRQELMSLPKTLADDVAKNLVMVAQLLDEDAERAYGYSRVALRLASRVPAVREAAGFASYATERFAEALTEFRAARRMTGLADLWPVMADCERGLGRPERALDMAGAPEVKRLDKAGQIEMRLVAAGARKDMGQFDAAVVTLQCPELGARSTQEWTARLRYAYADALLAAEREAEARDWFSRAAEVDTQGATNAAERLAELDGIEYVDTLDPEAAGDEIAETVDADGAAESDDAAEAAESDDASDPRFEEGDGEDYYEDDDEEDEEEGLSRFTGESVSSKDRSESQD